MLHIQAIHHVAILTVDYPSVKEFYTRVLGFTILNETFRPERNSYKLDLAIQGKYQIELFSFPTAHERSSYPEAKGLRHLAFVVKNLNEAVAYLQSKNIKTEEIRIDEITGSKHVFFFDPNNQPLELVESTELS